VQLTVAWQDYNGNEAFSKVVLPHTVRGDTTPWLGEKEEQMEPVCVCVCVCHIQIPVCFKPDASKCYMFSNLSLYEHTLTEMVQILYTTCDGNDISHFLGKSLGPAKC